MGQTASRIKKFFCPEKTDVLPVTIPQSNEVETPTSVRSSHEPLLNRTSCEPLATPRSPLVRGIGLITPPTTPVLPPSKRLKGGDTQYMNFPILLEEKTIEYIQRNKLMVILRGLSGSGKSTLCDNIKKVYQDAVICSADNFFMVDGVYDFNPEKLKDAHQYCQKCAQQAAKRNCHVIIIDNTNVRHWEYQVYLKMCKEYNYVAVVLEPQTPWGFNAEELAHRNTHGLTAEFLAKKLKMYQQALPIYFAWFVNEVDSQTITKIAWQWMESSLREIKDFFEDFSQYTQLESLEDMLKYFTRDNVILHVTAKFTNRGKPYGAQEYINDPVVKGSLGRCYPINVIGYVITPRTFGARIQLTDQQLELWGMDDYEATPDNLMFGGGGWGGPNKNEGNPPLQEEDEDIEEPIDLCQPKVQIIPQILDERRFCPISGKGSRAHITLGCANGVKPVTTGFDMIDIVSCEQRLKNEKSNLNENETAMDVDFPNEDVVATYNVSGAVLKSYGEGRWVVYPETKAVTDSLFSAFY